MKKRIAINGFGRIGRLIFRQLFNQPNIEIVAINDLANEGLDYLLKYDSVHGKLLWDVEYTQNQKNILVDSKKIKVFKEKNPLALPWKELNIDLVIESSGAFRTREKSQLHLEAGAKKVCISAPATQDIKTIVYGVNHNILSKEDQIISAASCTTNCLAPILQVLDEEFGIEKAMMTTIHSYTADQQLVDQIHPKDNRRARAAAVNIIPTSTGAAKAIQVVLPSLANKISGMAIRVPVVSGSLIDLVIDFKDQSTSVTKINQVMKKNASEVIAYNDDLIVSTDVIGNKNGTIFDATLTQSIEQDNKKLFKIFAWYDNEMSFVSQYIRLIKHWILDL